MTEKCAADRIQELKQTAEQGVDPEDLPVIIKNLGVILGYYAERGAQTFAEASKKVLAEAGEWIGPYLRRAWDSLREQEFGKHLPVAPTVSDATVELARKFRAEDGFTLADAKMFLDENHPGLPNQEIISRARRIAASVGDASKMTP